MAIKSVQEAFVEFEREKVRVPAWQNEQAQAVHPKITQKIEDVLGDVFARSFLAGSYRRKVQTVRLNDVDIIVVLNDIHQLFGSSALAALEVLKEAAATSPLVTACKTSVRAVKLEIEDVEFSVDLVAALEDPAGEVFLARYLPEENWDDWTAARPAAQTAAASAKNEVTNGTFIPGVRIIKFWNQRLGDGEKNLLPSYLVESILYHALTEPYDFDQACGLFFRLAAGHLASPAPSVSCPGDPANFVDERLEYERRTRGLLAVEEALVHVGEAEAATDIPTALEAWAQIFGTAFPAPSTDPRRLATSLGPEIVHASGRGIAASSGARPVIPARSWSRH
jgi:hypothetical protein